LCTHPWGTWTTAFAAHQEDIEDLLLVETAKTNLVEVKLASGVVESRVGRLITATDRVKVHINKYSTGIISVQRQCPTA